MDLIILFKGLLIGFSIAAPVGPIGVLCIRRTLLQGRMAGLLSGLGAATADAIYGAVAGFGLTFIAALLINHQFWLKLAGGLFLCYLGAKTLLTKPATQAASAKYNSLIGAYASTFVLTLTNPATIISFAAIFAGLGLAGTAGNYLAAGILVFGVFTGSALWWIALSGGVSLFRAKLNPYRLVWINRISGGVIGLFGLLVLISLKR